MIETTMADDDMNDCTKTNNAIKKNHNNMVDNNQIRNCVIVIGIDRTMWVTLGIVAIVLQHADSYAGFSPLVSTSL